MRTDISEEGSIPSVCKGLGIVSVRVHLYGYQRTGEYSGIWKGCGGVSIRVHVYGYQ